MKKTLIQFLTRMLQRGVYTTTYRDFKDSFPEIDYTDFDDHIFERGMMVYLKDTYTE